MEKKVISPVFVKSFEREDKANEFAAEHRSRVVTHYDYDFLRGKIIKTFEVQY